MSSQSRRLSNKRKSGLPRRKTARQQNPTVKKQSAGSAINTARARDPRFETVKSALLTKAGVELGSMFGSEGLKIGGKVFAMLVKGQLVAKLSALQVQGIVNSNAGKLFDPGHGRLMKEWVSIDSGTGSAWVKLAHEAKDFVAHNLPNRRKMK